MDTFSFSPWEQFFYDFDTVSTFVISQLRRLFQSLYGSKTYNYILYAALVPVVLMICTDIIFSFILSVRAKELRYFNCLSSRSWQSLSDLRLNRAVVSNRLQGLKELKYYGKDMSPKYTRLSVFSLHLKKYKNAKAGDVIRCKDGERFVYVGMRLNAKNSPLYAYRGSGGVYYSTMKPSKWSSSTGSQRGLSIKKSYKNKK